MRYKHTLNRTYKNRHAERPPYRAPDPLVNNPNAEVSQLEQDLTFIYRPPPTSLTPFSLTTAPASPLLRSPTSEDTSLPPVLRPSAARPEPPPTSDQAIEKIRKLRLENPKKYTRSVLAKRFNCTENFVGQVASLARSQTKMIRKQTEESHEMVRQTWGDKKSLAREIRKKRREFW
jgi:hypothetical protein